MAQLDLLMKALDTAVWEMGEAFKGLEDTDVWARPHPRLLSIGEMASHVAYWEALSFLGEGFESPLTATYAHYYTSAVEKPFTLDLGAAAVLAEIQGIHAACKASFLADPRDSEEKNPHRQDWTWGILVEYQAFHFAYHTGQMFTTRHLLGHQTVDN